MLFLSVSLILVASTAAATQPGPTHAELLGRLQSALEKCAWKVSTITGGPKGMMLLHRAKMEKLVEQLKAGQTVEAGEIAKLLEAHTG
jgi:hypothetical protein